MPVEELPIIPAFYDKQRFIQFGSQDCANWYMVSGAATKSQYGLYPAMGRTHVSVLGANKLNFASEPRYIFKTIDYMYVWVGLNVFQIDRFYNSVQLSNSSFNSLDGPIWADYLTVGSVVYLLFTAPTTTSREMFVITEEAGVVPSITLITDPQAPPNVSGVGPPLYVATFGSRFVVSVEESPQFYLSDINLGGVPLNPATCFQTSGSAIFATASGQIQQFAVLHRQLYIFSDYVTDIWADIPSQLPGKTFPFKFNTSNSFDYGIADPNSLDVDFGMMTWLGRNRNGLITFMTSTGSRPEVISTQAINVILQEIVDQPDISAFLANSGQGFLYQWENTIFYRVSAGQFFNFGALDIESSAQSLEYNFNTKTWARVIELNGERNRIQRHVFFAGKHLVTVEDESSMFEMRGDVYFNENRNPLQPDVQALDAFLKFPMRYELTTRQIYAPDYSEFITDYVEIDFVFGDKTFYKNEAPFDNTTYIVTEESTSEVPVYVAAEESTEGDEVLIIEDGTNTPTFSDNHYNALFKPHIELYWSDDGGIIFNSADLREFSPLGHYRWRMRWYSLGASRNRVYKLICVSSAPIVVLGGVMMKRRSSGGAN